jgi:hypothetical protein
MEYKLVISNNCRQIIQKIHVTDVYLDAKKLFNRHALNEQNVFIAGVQEENVKQTKATKMNDMGKYFVETVLFSLNYKFENSFYDGQGSKANKTSEGKVFGNFRWAFFI